MQTRIMKTIAQQLNITEFPFIITDKNGKEIYFENSNGDIIDDRPKQSCEGKMPDKYIGNDEIVFLKTKEDSRGANYNLYYKCHDIDAGGRRFGSEKELKDFAANYILSNQWYNKLRYADVKPLPESVEIDGKKYKLTKI